MTEIRTQQIWKCQECDEVTENVDELITLYECGNCGTIFSKEDSYDGCSHKCPDCGKFSSKLTEEGCPECQQGVCEEYTAGYDEGKEEWVQAEKAPTPQQLAIKKVHYHVVFHTPGDGAQVNLAPYESLDEALTFWRHPSSGAVENPDGSFTQYYDHAKTKVIATVKFVECTKHGEGMLEYHQVVPRES